MEPLRFDIEECNIGTQLKPKMIKLSKSLWLWGLMLFMVTEVTMLSF